MAEKRELNRKEHEMILIEIDNCRENIEFYKDQITNTEDKLEELERLKRGYEYY